jgi:hypothetical protein
MLLRVLGDHLRKLHRHRVLVNAGLRDPHSSTDKSACCHRTPMMFQMGPIRPISPASSPAAVLTGRPFHSEGTEVATSTFTRLAAASVLAIRSLICALVRWRLWELAAMELVYHRAAPVFRKELAA